MTTPTPRIPRGYWRVEPGHNLTRKEFEAMRPVLEGATERGEWLVVTDGITLQWVEAAVVPEAQAIPLIDVDLLARALSQSEWNDMVSPPAAMWGYRGWAERIIARLASESSTAVERRTSDFRPDEVLTFDPRSALPVKEGEPE